MGIGAVFRLEVRVAVPKQPQGFMGVHIVVGQIDDAAGNIGAMVRGALQTGEQV